MRAFFLAMALYPDVQKKAQAEIDEVVGASRLPEFSDRPSLPYTCALVYELLRWHIVTPIGVPHRAVSDDEYNGYLIPAGATILANIWYGSLFSHPNCNRLCALVSLTCTSGQSLGILRYILIQRTSFRSVS